MDPNDSADLFAILGLAGAGLGLMLVGSLDMPGVAVILAVLVPTLAASSLAVVTAVVTWRHVANRSAMRRGEYGADHRDSGSTG